MLGSAKIVNFKSIDQKFHADDENTVEFKFWAIMLDWAIIRPKSQKG
jgi:hypothetical protein